MKIETENSDKMQSKDKHWQFKKGESGNPAGKPKGARNKATLAVQALFEGEAEAISRKAIELALTGDMTALRLCLERIAPARKDYPVNINLPTIKNPADASLAMSALLTSVAEGEITPNEAGEVAKLVETYIKALEAHQYDNRLKTLEERTAK